MYNRKNSGPSTDPCGTPKLILFVSYLAPLTKVLAVFVLETLGAVSIRKTVLPGMAIPMLKIRRPNGRLIFNMEIAIRR